MRPILSYYGGKQRIASRICEQIDRIPHTVYVEPYAGGAAVLFAKTRPSVSNSHDYREVINDLDERLITLYRVARQQPEEFQRWIEFTPYSQAEHKQAAKILKNPAEHSELERAWAYYTNVNQSFANQLGCGWGVKVFSENSAATWQSKRKSLPLALERLKEVHIACEPALACIDRWDSPQTLFYIDPPYFGTDLGHYDGFTLNDWQQLCKKLDTIQGSYILSNYALPEEPASAQQRIEIETVCSSSGSGKVGRRNQRHTKATAEELGNRKRTEILWICDRSAKMRDELKRVAYAVQPSLFDSA